MKLFAYVDDDLATIFLRSGIKGEEAESTLLHEVIHACLFRSGTKFQLDLKQEEGIVRALEHGIYQAGYRLTNPE